MEDCVVTFRGDRGWGGSAPNGFAASVAGGTRQAAGRARVGLVTGSPRRGANLVGGEPHTAAAGMGLGRALGGEACPKVGLMEPAPAWTNVVGQDFEPLSACLDGPAPESLGLDMGGRGDGAVEAAQAGRRGP